MANPVGRPKKTLDDLPDGWKKNCLLLAEQGASDVELRDLLDISTDLWYRFIDEEPQFSETIRKCSQKCEVWWQKKGRLNLENKEFSSTLWYMNMKNRFGWADKREVDHTTKGDKIESISPHEFVKAKDLSQ